MTDLGEFEFSVLDPEARFLGISDGVISAFRFEPGISGLAVIILQAPEESLEGSIDSKENILEHLGVDFVEEKNSMFVAG